MLDIWNPLPHNQPGTRFQNWPDINFKSQGTWKEWIENHDSFTFVKYPNLTFWNTQKWSVLWLSLFWNTWNYRFFEKSKNHMTLCNLKTMSDVFLWMKHANPNSTMWLKCCQPGVSRAPKKLFSSLFQFFVLLFCRLLQRDLGELVCFVVLQVIAKGSWWASFSDGARSWLLNENYSWAMWIMALQGDWQGDFKGVKGWRVEELYDASWREEGVNLC